jgi:hypothetical protein
MLEQSLAVRQNQAAEGACRNAGNLGFFCFFSSYVLFNRHVSELAGVKNIAAFLAFNKFCVFLARHNTHARVPTKFLHIRCFGKLFLDW